MTTERIDIIVSEKGSRVVKRNLDDLGMGARGAAAGVGCLAAGVGARGWLRGVLRASSSHP